MKTLTIRVSDEEHKLMQTVAARRFMTITGITRAHFNALFIEDGMTLDPAEEARRALEVQAKAALAPPKPVVERRAVPARGWAAEIVSRADKGEKLADIAESYGQSLDLVKKMYKLGKENQQAARDFSEMRAYAENGNTAPPPEQELVYDPVDPDNPTEEEQATSAEIARRKLVAFADHMGLNL
jgi:hypothetical protein